MTSETSTAVVTTVAIRHFIEDALKGVELGSGAAGPASRLQHLLNLVDIAEACFNDTPGAPGPVIRITVEDASNVLKFYEEYRANGRGRR